MKTTRTMAWLCALVAGTAAAPLSAQTPEAPAHDTATLDRFGGFVGLSTHFGDIGEVSGIFVGAELGMVFERNMYLGMAGYGLASRMQDLEFGYGGALIGYAVPLSDPISIGIETVLAGGGVKSGSEWDAVLVFEPTVSGMLRFDRIARLGVGVGYRYVGGGGEAVTDSDLRGVVGTVTLRFGWF